jgi:hypothetical protein
MYHKNGKCRCGVAADRIADLPVLVLNLYPIGEKTSTTPTLLVIYCAESAGE